MYPRLIALLLIAGSLAAAATGASAPSEPAIVSAGAHGLSILVPGQPASVAAEATAPGPAATGVADGFVFPADGSLVRTGALSSSVSSRATGTAGAQACRRRPRRHPLQRRGDRRERRGAREGVRGGGRRGRLHRDEPCRLRDSGGDGAEPARPAGRLGLSDRARAGCRRRLSRTGRRTPAAQSTRCTSSSRPITAACPLAPRSSSATPRRPRRPRRRTTGRNDAGDHHGEARSPRAPAREAAEAAAEAARARGPEQARSGLPRAADGRVGAALACRLRLPRLRTVVVHRHLRQRARRRRLASRPGHLRAARGAAPRRRRRDASSPSAGTTSAATGSGCATGRATSSTTPTSPRSRRSPSTATR